MILLKVFFLCSAKLFSLQPFPNLFFNVFAFIAKPLCKRYCIFLCSSHFLLASKPFVAVTGYQGSLFLFYISCFLGAPWGLVFVCIYS
jgi:hypothetical protein